MDVHPLIEPFSRGYLATIDILVCDPANVLLNDYLALTLVSLPRSGGLIVLRSWATSVDNLAQSQNYRQPMLAIVIT